MQQVIDMFLNGKSAYEIHKETDMSFKEITHYIRVDEKAKQAHKKTLMQNKY